MKQLLSIILICGMLGLESKGQVYLGMNLNSNGAGLDIGGQVRTPDSPDEISLSTLSFNAGITMPLISAEKATTTYAGIGYTVALAEEDAFTITAVVGGAVNKYKDFSAYDERGNYAITDVVKFKGYGKLEIGKDWHIGRLYVFGSHSHAFVWGIGMKAFFK